MWCWIDPGHRLAYALSPIVRYILVLFVVVVVIVVVVVVVVLPPTPRRGVKK